MLKTINSGKDVKIVDEDHCRHPRRWDKISEDEEKAVYQAYCETCGEQKQTFKEVFFNHSSMNDDTVCECGAEKKPEYKTCFKCKKRNAGPDEVCHCGRLKGAKYPTCYQCANS